MLLIFPISLCCSVIREREREIEREIDRERDRDREREREKEREMTCLSKRRIKSVSLVIRTHGRVAPDLNL